jgi:hypothetical protein
LVVLLTSFPNPAQVQGFSISPNELDKDRDDQMRVVAAVSNLRARNYAIPEVRCVCWLRCSSGGEHTIWTNCHMGSIKATAVLVYSACADGSLYCVNLRKCLAAFDVRQC